MENTSWKISLLPEATENFNSIKNPDKISEILRQNHQRFEMIKAVLPEGVDFILILYGEGSGIVFGPTDKCVGLKQKLECRKIATMEL